jgi:hypothetical protein
MGYTRESTRRHGESRPHRRGGDVVDRVRTQRSGSGQAHRRLGSGTDGLIHAAVDWRKGTAYVQG